VVEHAYADDAGREVELRLAPHEALLRELARGRLEEHAGEAHRAPRRVVLEASLRLDPQDLARIAADDAMLAAVQRAPALGGIERGEHTRPVLRMHAREPHIVARTARGIDRVAQQLEVIGGPDRLAGRE